MEKKWHQYVGVRAALIVAGGAIVVAGMNILQERSKLKQENSKYITDIAGTDTLISDLEGRLAQKVSEIQRLEMQLTPFRTIALERYMGSEQEALKKLANEIQELKNPLKRLVASATSHVEVTIRSDEQISATHMTRGGYLAFGKGRQPLLVISGIQSEARQTGNGEVIYSGDFSIEPGQPLVGKPIELLQESDLIQIAFRSIPANSQVLQGKASVVVNGDTRLEFEIPSQQMQNDLILIRDMTRGGSWGQHSF